MESKQLTQAGRVQLARARRNRVYVAGPMSGMPGHNFPAFNAAADSLRAQGWHVENPAEHGEVDGATWADYMHCDVACGDQVAQPLGCIFVEFVVVRQFHCATSTAVTAWECCTHSRNSYRPMLARNRSVMAADCTASVCTPSGFTLWGS